VPFIFGVLHCGREYVKPRSELKNFFVNVILIQWYLLPSKNTTYNNKKIDKIL